MSCITGCIGILDAQIEGSKLPNKLILTLRLSRLGDQIIDTSSKHEGCLLLFVMPPISLHKEAISVYQLLMISCTLFTPFHSLEEACHQFGIDINTIIAIEQT